MSLKTHSLVSSSLKASYLAVTLAFALPATTYAAALGDIHVISSFGQPFKAEIPLSNISKREDGKLVPGLGKPEDYQRSNASFNAAYASLQFGIIKKGDQQFIEITSATPLNISLYDLVVELRGSIQRQVKAYSFMMDSASADASKGDADTDANTKSDVTTPTVIAPVGPISSPVSTPADNSVQPNSDQQLAQQVIKAPANQANQSNQPISSSPQPINAAPKPKTPVKPATGLGEPATAVAKKSDVIAEKDTIKRSFLVSKGDILGAISQQMKPRNVSLNQMMVALLRANPDAFVDNNINRLRSGVVLRVPSASEASSIDVKEANQIVIAQIQDFDRYRQALANHVANSRANKTKHAQRAGGKVALHVNEEKNKDQPKDRLTLSKAGKSGDKKEAQIASKKAQADAESRIKALEKNVADLQKLLAMKNQALAEAQAKADSNASANDDNKKTDQKGFFSSIWDSLKNAWKHFSNFVGSLNDIPHFAQIAVGLLIALIGLLVGLIVSRIRKNNKPAPEEVKDDASYAAVATGAAALSQTGEDEDTAVKDDTPPVDIANKIDFDLNLDNAQVTNEDSVADEPAPEAQVDNAPANQTDEVDNEPAVTETNNTATAQAPEPEPEVAAATSTPEPEAPATAEPEVTATTSTPEPEASATAEPASGDASVSTDNAAPEEEKLELDIPNQVDENGMPTPEQAQRDELTMKLDLASAYQEIGDNEGARELLEEIINSNNPEFVAQAKEKLAALPKA